MKFFKNNWAFSLIEIMITAALLGVVAVMFSKVITTQIKSSKSTTVKSEIILITNSIQNDLISPAACVNSLPAIPLAGASMPLTEIKNKANLTHFRVYDPVAKAPLYGNRNVKVNSIELKAGIYDFATETYFPNVFPAAGTTGVVTVVVELQKVSKVTNQAIITKRFLVKILLDATSNVQTCYSLLEKSVKISRRKACEDIGGEWADIGASKKCVLKEISVQNAQGLKIGNIDTATRVFTSNIEINNSTTPLVLDGTLKFKNTPNVNCVSGKINYSGTVIYICDDLGNWIIDQGDQGPAGLIGNRGMRGPVGFNGPPGNKGADESPCP